jgi:oxidase EvaA
MIKIICDKVQKSYDHLFYKSGSKSSFYDFLENFKKDNSLETYEKSLLELDNWGFDENGNYGHISRKFFSIKGVRFQDMEFPIIDQPEIGILGVLSTYFDGVLHFLVQLKDEPGNELRHQLSPTVQATKSNYTTVHGGKVPYYLDYFLNENNSRILFDQYLSEQGFRYYKKRNRNMIVLVHNQIEVKPGFFWLTLGQIYELFAQPLFINACLRSVLSMLPKSVFMNDFDNYSFNILNSKLIRRKENFDFNSTLVDLSILKGWGLQYDGIFKSHESKYFSLVGLQIIGNSREVSKWCQPLLKESGSGQYGLILGDIDGKLCCFWKFVSEPGLFDKVELGPTWIIRSGESTKSALLDEFITKGKELQSILMPEEGGRFYHSNFFHTIIHIGEVSSDALGDEFIALDADQTFFSNTILSNLNIEARSLWFTCKNEWFY